MPGIIGWVTLRRSKPTHLQQLDRQSLTSSGSAPKFSKRTILTGLGSLLLGFDFFRPSPYLKRVVLERPSHGHAASLSRKASLLRSRHGEGM
jgi:hypothetical protein